MTLAEFGQKCSGARLFSEVLFSCVPMVSTELDAEDSKVNVVWILLSKCLEFNILKRFSNLEIM